MKAFLGSMVGRVFLVLVAGIILSAAVTLNLANRERRQTIAQVRSLHAVERVAQFVALLEAVPVEARRNVAAAVAGAGIDADFSPPAAIAGGQDSDLTVALRDRLGSNAQVSASVITDKDCPARRGAADAAQYKKRAGCQTVWLKLRDGTPLHLVLHAGPAAMPIRPPAPWLSHDYLLFFAACVGLLAYAVARMSTRPLRQLARAAADLGRDIERPPLPETGPAEVRHAAAAFNVMQSRLRRHIHERTHMLAAITHDLQTPLTRLRLRLEKVRDEDLRARLVEDLSAMQDMVREGLDLTRSMDSREPAQTLDLDSILDSVCADSADAGLDVTLSGRTGASIMARLDSPRRCLTNLIDNAVKYGGYARVAAVREDSKVVIRVRDGGPGIPVDRLEAVLDPFYRLETSRSRETGGTGLGLTIARNIAEKEGGTLKLRNHPDGGLEAILELPIKTR